MASRRCTGGAVFFRSSRKFDFLDSSGFLPEGSAAAAGMESEGGGGNLLGELLKMAEDDKGKKEDEEQQQQKGTTIPHCEGNTKGIFVQPRLRVNCESNWAL